jgi:SanA protein
MKIRKKLLKRLALVITIGLIISIVAVWWANHHIKSVAQKYLYEKVEDVPAANVGLVLGTVKGLKSGRINPYFQYRIEAAAALFKAGKVKHLIVSGDNHVKGYDEPEDMRLALIAAGVPDSCITLDYAGFRTLDSIIRCWKVFGQTSFIIISQQFHNERALFLARHYGLDATALNAKDVGKSFGRTTNAREYLARVKAVIDLYILNKQPKFLGDAVEIKL